METLAVIHFFIVNFEKLHNVFNSRRIITLRLRRQIWRRIIKIINKECYNLVSFKIGIQKGNEKNNIRRLKQHSSILKDGESVLRDF